MPGRTYRTAAVLLFVSVLQAACSDTSPTQPGDPTPGNPTPVVRVATTVTIADPGPLTDGDVRTLQATVADQFGAPMTGVPVQWALSDSTRASLTAAGVLRAHTEGSTTVVATAAGRSASRPLTIARHPAARIELNHGALDLVVGAQRQLAATVRGADDRILLGRLVTWESSQPLVARVAESGAIVAVSPGQTTVTARFGAVTATMRVTVAGYADRYQAVTVDGRALPAVVEQDDLTDPQGYPYQLVQRLEQATVQFDGRYSIDLTLGLYRRYSFQGNVIEQLVQRQVLRDRGAVEYNWLDGSARLESEMVGGVQHQLRPEGSGVRIAFRIPGTDTVLGLSMRRVP